MAGRPKLRQLNLRLQERDEGEDYIFDAIAAGIPLTAIARSLGVSKAYLYVWRKEEGHAQRRIAAWDAAMELSAISKDEEGAAILDKLAQQTTISREEVALATSRAKYRQWQAEKRSPKYRPGQKVDVNVTGSIEHLHLEALRQLGGPVEQDEVLDAELIEEPDGEDVIQLLRGA